MECQNVVRTVELSFFVVVLAMKQVKLNGSNSGGK